ncbi:protein PET117 [Aspergillus melleus]|uniref:protein PET117 n=1 Tax=Aspergillus melleus TaxID=138277 RepID=UPI001E8DAA26|nr:uncharacterized protein LDX57_008806 [Aspergillus melleus]KAH8431147.1 hypothetical protein LDX57_008806 [Aspergillus melleus]
MINDKAVRVLPSVTAVIIADESRAGLGLKPSRTLFAVWVKEDKMSRASKLTLAATGLGTAGIVYFVHWSQEQERANMHKGVERDMEKQRVRHERQADFEMQKRLEEEYLKLQKVSPSVDASSPGGDNNPAKGT